MTEPSQQWLDMVRLGGMERMRAHQWLYRHVDEVRASLGLPSQRAEAVVRVRANMDQMMEDLKAFGKATRHAGEVLGQIAAKFSVAPVSTEELSGRQIADSE